MFGNICYLGVVVLSGGIRDGPPSFRFGCLKFRAQGLRTTAGLRASGLGLHGLIKQLYL